MEKMCFVKIQNGKRCKGVLPRYVSSVEIVGDDLVIHTSDKPFPVSQELADAISPVFFSAENLSKYSSIYCEFVIPGFAFNADCLARSFHNFIEQFGVDAWNNLINYGTVPVAPEVSE